MISFRRLAMFFALGCGVQLPWSVAGLVIQWAVVAAQRPPTPPASLLNSLPAVLTLTLSAGNVLAVSAIFWLRLVDTLRPWFTVGAPLLLCAALMTCAAAAAALDVQGGDDVLLSGKTLVAVALPLSFLLGCAACLAGCGCAALAAAGDGMKAFIVGQSLAQLSSAVLSFALFAASAPRLVTATADATARSLAAHAELTLLVASAALVFCCLAWLWLPPESQPVVVYKELTAESEYNSLSTVAADGETATAVRWRVPNSELQEPIRASEPEESAATAQASASAASEEEEDACTLDVDTLHEPLLTRSSEEPAERASRIALRLYSVALFLTTSATLSAFPGITSFLVPADATKGIQLPLFGPLSPALLVPSTFVVFAAGDLAGRLVGATLPTRLCTAQLTLGVALSRFALLPLLLACNIETPAGRWAMPRLLAAHDSAPLALIAVLALSNGLATALALQGGPACAEECKRAAASTGLQASLVSGVAAGSVLGIVISAALQA
jgi:hypothetical protein